VAAIGPATEAALEQRGIIPDLVPQSSISEDVAASMSNHDLRGKTVLIVRALEGREVLQEKLTEAGADVRLAPCYRTVPDNSQAELARAEIEAGRVQWITFTSSSTVQNFVDALGAQFIAAHRTKFRVACIGPITAETARQLDITPDLVAKSAGVEALVKVILDGAA
jgi:uroporphyrinogen III methyltransferase/synthase